jgi:hypothetical protein
MITHPPEVRITRTAREIFPWLVEREKGPRGRMSRCSR